MSGAEDPFSPGSSPVVGDCEARIECDVAIIGSGIGGATLAWALRDSGARVLVIERGDFLPQERENWSPRAVHIDGRYKNSDPWLDSAGTSFTPGSYHYVGGSSKLYGAVMARMREADFGEVEHHDGLSPAWPVSYTDMEPHYCAAERLYWVHGGSEDPTEPWRSEPFPFAPIEHEPPVARFAERLLSRGVRPYALPLAVDRRPGGACVLCKTCDSFPCMVNAKADADLAAMRPALASQTVRLMTRAQARRVLTSADGAAVDGVEIERDGRRLTVHAERYVIAAGAVNTAALLLRSTGRGSATVANSSGMVGRRYMAHTTSFLVGVRPAADEQLIFSKTLGINDWYHAGRDNRYPLGNVQMLGKLQGPMIKPARRAVPLGVLEWFTRRSMDLFVQTEDLPRDGNRVVVEPSGAVRLLWKPTNEVPHRELVGRMRALLRSSGYPLTFTQRLGIEATAHQCGTAVMGEDPALSVVDRDCRSHDHPNLWILDASVFPSSSGVNPALTVAANALRVAAGGAFDPA